MLEFPVDYFQNEEREGVLVDSMMKTVLGRIAPLRADGRPNRLY